MQNDKKSLRQDLEAFERAVVATTSREPSRSDRVLNRKALSLHGRNVEFDASLKEVNGRPRFVTITLRSPAKATFIPFHYDAKGELTLNKKVSNRLFDFLEEHEATTEFRTLLQCVARGEETC
ncbi:hypothetical protein [Desulfohalovibrio reitneri]|jgi:hypothetical protein|uniref:hypothetical protein n=1 Tax=Desulfohalovibrio reitneri TaxID=1307759 RepID=UPI00068A0532|nr:hypothetical protein [Desulfohalovibrio reitneri]